MGYRRGLAEKRRRELAEEVRRIREVLSGLPEVKRAWVIGSFSRGEVRAGSDLDLILEVESREPFERRWERYYLALRPRVPTDLLVYTPEELSELKERAFFRKALKEAWLIYEGAGS